MASQQDLDFTYTTIDKVVRLNMAFFFQRTDGRCGCSSCKFAGSGQPSIGTRTQEGSRIEAANQLLYNSSRSCLMLTTYSV